MNETHGLSNATAFRQTIIDLYGDAGLKWLEHLPDLLAWCAKEWSLTIEAPFTSLSYNYVAPAFCADGTRAVLKLCVPTPSCCLEHQALILFQEHGTVQLLKSDTDRGAIMLRRADSGTMLSSLCPDNDSTATAAAADVMRRLRVLPPEGHTFPSVADWGCGLQRLRRTFNGNTGPFPIALVERAEALFLELLASSDTPHLLHGDLHHFNILSHGDSWLVIDPQGVTGELAYETGALLRNPMPYILTWPNLKHILQCRIWQLADELAFDRQRIHGWGLAQAVLSGWWSYEDHGKGWEGALHIAEILSEIVV